MDRKLSEEQIGAPLDLKSIAIYHLCERLSELLKDPSPGTPSWFEARNHCAANLFALLQELKVADLVDKYPKYVPGQSDQEEFERRKEKLE